MLTRLRSAIVTGRQDGGPVLPALLVVMMAVMFAGHPLAAMGFLWPITALVVVTLFLITLLCWHDRVALVVSMAALVARAITAVMEMFDVTYITEVMNVAAAILAMGALAWVISGVVFGPGRMTIYRVNGAVLLYLAIAAIFSWLYRLVAIFVPGSFSGIEFRLGDAATGYHYTYFSLTTLTTLGFGDIVPVSPIARSLATMEAVIGQLYIAIILGRILTIYSAHRKEDS